jgi:alkylhydroperoxidase/carboxymuconolactone decarboxylase family protein YurZ
LVAAALAPTVVSLKWRGQRRGTVVDKHDATRTALDAESVIEKAIAARGDVFPEWRLIAETSPETMAAVTNTGGYLHKYEGVGGDRQELSVQMRELIATPAICSKSDLRHAPNHVRRMYRLGMTNAVVLEGALAFATAVGWATMLNVSYAIMQANSSDYPFGTLPDGGEPKELVPFPELDMGRTRQNGADEKLLDLPAWRYGAEIDSELVSRISAWAEWSGGVDGGDGLLGPGPRALIIVAALATRGDADRAARFVGRAYDYGMSKRQVLEAISAVVPMTGMISLEIGLEAMRLADPER